MFYGRYRNLGEKCETGHVFEVTHKWTAVADNGSRYIRYRTPAIGLNYIEGIIINANMNEIDVEVLVLGLFWYRSKLANFNQIITIWHK